MPSSMTKITDEMVAEYLARKGFGAGWSISLIYGEEAFKGRLPLIAVPRGNGDAAEPEPIIINTVIEASAGVFANEFEVILLGEDDVDAMLGGRHKYDQFEFVIEARRPKK